MKNVAIKVGEYIMIGLVLHTMGLGADKLNRWREDCKTKSTCAPGGQKANTNDTNGYVRPIGFAADASYYES